MMRQGSDVWGSGIKMTGVLGVLDVQMCVCVGQKLPDKQLKFKCKYKKKTALFQYLTGIFLGNKFCVAVARMIDYVPPTPLSCKMTNIRN